MSINVNIWDGGKIQSVLTFWDEFEIRFLLSCLCSGLGAVGCHSGSVHGGRGSCPRSHQPHSETAQKGGAIISQTTLAMETWVTQQMATEFHNPVFNNWELTWLNHWGHIIKAISAWPCRHGHVIPFFFYFWGFVFSFFAPLIPKAYFNLLLQSLSLDEFHQVIVIEVIR